MKKAFTLFAVLLSLVIAVAVVAWSHRPARLEEPATIEAVIEAWQAPQVPTEITRTARTVTWLNLRQGPGYDRPVITVLDPGALVEFVGDCVGSWCEITAAGKHGFVGRRYLEETP